MSLPHPPAPSLTSSPAPAGSLVVCLGAAAGGLRALEAFFHHMPPSSGCSFVVVQPLSPDFHGLMEDLLGRQTTMNIHPVEECMSLEPDSIYLIPAKKLMTVRDGRLHPTERVVDHTPGLPINAFLNCLAADAGAHAVAIILSGTGTDGSEGIRAVHEAGGLVIVQDPETAEFDEMPRSALATGMADYELPPGLMPEAVVAFAGATGLARPGRDTSVMAGATANPAPTPARGLLHACEHLLGQHLPAGFIVNDEGMILHCIGDSARFLLSPRGRARENILARTAGDLRLALSTLIPQVLRDRAPAGSNILRAELAGGGHERIGLTVSPLPEDRAGTRLLHILLRNSRPPGAPGDAFTSPEAQDRRIVELEVALASTKESLQATVEELYAVNEEFRAANEELQSINEELKNINAEFESKNAALNTLNADLDNLLKATDVGTLFLDRDLRIRMFNPSIEHIFRLLPRDLGRPIEHIAYQLADQAGMIDDARAVLKTGHIREGEVRTRDGHWLLKRILPFRATDRSIQGVVLTFTRIDVIKTMQDKLDLAMISSRLAWWEWDVPTGRFHTHAGGTCILGYEIGRLAPNVDTWLQLTHPDDLPLVRTTLEACLQGRSPEWDCEHRCKDAEGRWRWVHDKGRVIERDSSGRALRMVGTTQDIHTRRTAEAEIIKLSQAIAQTEVSIVITDVNGDIEYVNPYFTRATGYESREVIGQNPRLLQSSENPPGVYAQLWGTITRGEPWRGELVNRRKDGTLFTERVSISPVKDANDRVSHFIEVREDITALKAEQESHRLLEHQLAQSQKMETLGTLAGGVAHDFNNLLTSILGYTHLAQDGIAADHPARTSLKQIERAGNRAADLVRRILAFSRNHTPSHLPVTPGRLYAEAVPMLRSSLPATIELDYHDESGGCTVLGDGTQLQQVLLNLCTNAAHAIGAVAGRIEIGLSRVEITTPLPVQVGSLNPGPYLRLFVADTGCGMDASMIGRVFKPFFTTKSDGEGTGLGLAIVHNSVIAHQGAVIVRSTPGQGTTFTVYFPSVSPQPEAPPAEIAATPGSAVGRGRRIAIIDDDVSIAELNRMALAQVGYAPKVHARAEECLAALRADPTSADLVITDQTMPGMTGIELAKGLRSLGVSTPVIIASGYNRLVTGESLAELKRVSFLAKPFTLASLLGEVSRALGSHEESGAK
jgi:two-component system CheB/CheR fusion protein